MTAGFTRYAPASRSMRPDGPWLFIVGASFIAMLPSSVDTDVRDALWWHGSDDHATIESLVGSIPLTGESAVRSFGVVSLGTFAGEAETTVTAVVRGSVAIDLFSVGGARRFTAGGIQPWVLADFRAVTGFAFDDEDAGADQVATTADSLPVVAGIVEGALLVWAARLDGMPLSSGDGGRIGLGARTGHADDNDETIIRGRRAQMPPTPAAPSFPHPAAPRSPSAPTPVAEAVPVDRVEDGLARPMNELPDETTSIAPPTHAQPRRSFRIRGRDEVFTLDVPAYLGRRPRAALAPSGPDPRLVSVHSPEQLVSSTHLHIQQVGDAVVVTDLGSTNGSRLLGVEGRRARLRPGESRVVLPGSSIDIGDGNIIDITPDE